MNTRFGTFRFSKWSIDPSWAIALSLLIAQAEAATIDVQLDGTSFIPATVNINVGDTVRWKWVGGSHSSTSGSQCSPAQGWDSGTLGPGSSFSHTFTEARSYSYFCTVHCPSMSGVVRVTDPNNPISKPIPQGAVSVKLTPVASGLVAPNWGISVPSDPSRLFVTDQVGTLWVIDLASGNKREFANLRGLLVRLGVNGTNSFDERGLLGVAFHPNYTDNGLLYTYTSEPVNGVTADFSTLSSGEPPDHLSVIREWQVANPKDIDANPATNSSRVVMRIAAPAFNHNGGGLNFGPDGMLYIATGDGGNGDDQGTGHDAKRGNGQTLSTVLGKILRIDPVGRTSSNGQYAIPPKNPFSPRKSPALGGQTGCNDGRCDEIYAYGLRNPFRFSFDSLRGQLFAADVGQNAIEEVDVIRRGGNFGWRVREGAFCFRPNGDDPGTVTRVGSCRSDGLIPPIAQYDHDEGHAVIGGFVYRGAEIAGLIGRYVFGDYAKSLNNDGRLFYLSRKVPRRGVIAKSQVLELQLAGQSGLGMSLLGFGQDAAGELYVLANRTGIPAGDTGVVLRIDAP